MMGQTGTDQKSKPSLIEFLWFNSYFEEVWTISLEWWAPLPAEYQKAKNSGVLEGIQPVCVCCSL